MHLVTTSQSYVTRAGSQPIAVTCAQARAHSSAEKRLKRGTRLFGGIDYIAPACTRDPVTGGYRNRRKFRTEIS